MEQAPKSNQKTILAVDDDTRILAVVSALLVDGEYNVLIASHAAEALRQSRDYKGEIHLLLSDFLMPGKSGVELAREMTLERRHLKVLLMSSFPERMLDLNAGWHFLAKPFIPAQLSARITGLVFPAAVPHFPNGPDGRIVRRPVNELLRHHGAGAGPG